MKVFIEQWREERDVAASSVSELLASLKLIPETVLVIKNGVLVPEDELLSESDAVRVLSVISGG